jgi:hypothetical protein
MMEDTQAAGTIANRIAALASLAPNWDGNGSPAPSAASIATARQFVDHLGGLHPDPSIGPAVDEGVVFEWDLDDGFSIYCYARPNGVEVAAFDDERDYIEIMLPARYAAELVRIVMSGRTVGGAA